MDKLSSSVCIVNIYSLLLGIEQTKCDEIENFIEVLKISIRKCQTNFWQIDQLSSIVCQTGDLPRYSIKKKPWKSSTRTAHWRIGDESHE
jgi:hypothetical protein